MLFESYFYEGKDDMTKFKLFCDMDGVLSNFYKAFDDMGEELNLGLTFHQYEKKYGDDKLWDLIHSKGKEQFWSDMSWNNGGKKLWNHIKQFNPTILSAPSKSKYCVDGKTVWVKRELGENIPFIFERHKYKYANDSSILIDDNEKKINDWITKGDGIGILHKSTEDTIKQLKLYGFQTIFFRIVG